MIYYQILLIKRNLYFMPKRHQNIFSLLKISDSSQMIRNILSNSPSLWCLIVYLKWVLEEEVVSSGLLGHRNDQISYQHMENSLLYRLWPSFHQWFCSKFPFLRDQWREWMCYWMLPLSEQLRSYFHPFQHQFMVDQSSLLFLL